MREEELSAALDEHDALVVKCVLNEIPLEDFWRSYDSFFQRWALDGHEGDAKLLSQFADRITVHRRIWDEVETCVTSTDHGINCAQLGFIGPDEALKRLRAIAHDGGLLDGPRPAN